MAINLKESGGGVNGEVGRGGGGGNDVITL